MSSDVECNHDSALSRRSMLIGAAGAAFLASSRALAEVDAARKLTLTTPDGRAIDVWRWQPRAPARGTIAFFHGALSAPWKYERLLGAWAAAGYEVLAPLHVDSTDHPLTKQFPGAASWKARIEDMREVSRAITARRFLAAGHSYGALTALTMGGAEAVMPEGLHGRQRDPRVAAVVAFSPPNVMPMLISATGYAKLAVPALIQTGDKDVPLGSTDAAGWRGHLAAYEAARIGGDRYALILGGVDHYFGGLICRELPGPLQTAQLDQAITFSTLFMQSYLGGNTKDRTRLEAKLADSGPAIFVRR